MRNTRDCVNDQKLTVCVLTSRVLAGCCAALVGTLLTFLTLFRSIVGEISSRVCLGVHKGRKGEED